MVVAVDESAILGHAEPVIPVEPVGRRVAAVWYRGEVAPVFFRKRMHFFDFADDAAVDHGHGKSLGEVG